PVQPGGASNWHWHFHARNRGEAVQPASDLSLLRDRAASIRNPFYPPLREEQRKYGRYPVVPWHADNFHPLRGDTGNDGPRSWNRVAASRGRDHVRFHPRHHSCLLRPGLRGHPPGGSAAHTISTAGRGRRP